MKIGRWNMRKYIKGAMIITALAFFNIFFNSPLPLEKPKDPNIVSIPVPPEPKRQRAENIPPFTPFNEEEVLAVNLKTHTFYIYTITEDVFTNFEKYSTLMVSQGVKEITINLHSPGGELDAAKLIEEQIDILKEHGVHVKTIVESSNACMSACPIIFLAGDEKIASSNSIFMFHSPYLRYPHNVSQAEIRFVEKDLAKARDEFVGRLNAACPADATIGLFIYDHGDHFLSATDLQTRCSGFFTRVDVVTFGDAIKNLKAIPNTNGRM